MEAKKTAIDYLDEGDRLLEEENLEGAIAAYRQAIELNPDLSWSHHNLGEALAKVGELEEAIASYRRAIELNPDFSWSYHHLGDALYRQEKWEEAVVAFRMAIELNADHFGSYCGLGQSLVNLGQLDEAIAAYRRASEVEPDADWIQYRLGEVLQQRTQLDLEGAIASYRRALELNPDEASYYNLGEVLAAQGNTNEASVCYYKAFKLNPHNIQANQKRPRIYDCFTFFNEIDILKIRIEELKDVVDKFILVEATKTFSGNPKPLYYQDFIHEFAEYQDKIIHYVVDDMPEVIDGDRWPLEIHQRDCIIRPLRVIHCGDEDIILISDVDEIPKKEKIGDAIDLLSHHKFVIFTHDLYHYHLDNFKSNWWCGTVACKYKDFKIRTATQVRRSDEGFWSPNWKAADIRKDGFQHPFIEKGGWHLTYFGGAQTRRYKQQNYSHAEGDNSQQKGIPLINFDVARPTTDEESLGKYYYDVRDVEGKDIPDYLKINIRQYRHFLKPKMTQMAISHADLYLEIALSIYKQNLDIAVNLWCSARELNPEIGKKRSFLSDLPPVDYFKISPQQLCNQSGQLIHNKDGYQLVSCSEEGQLVSFGPYIKVPDGIYRVKIDVEVDTREVKETNNHQIFGFKFDIVTDHGNSVAWDEKVDIQYPQLEFYLELTNAQEELQVRFYSMGHKFAITSIELALLYRIQPNQSINNYAHNCGNKRDRNIKAYFEYTTMMQNNLDELLADTNYHSGEKMSTDFEECLELGKKFTEQGDFEGSIKYYRQGCQLNPKHFGSYVGLGKSLEKLGQLDEAVVAYRRACQLNPDSFECYWELGKTLYQQRLLKLKALQSHPDVVATLLEERPSQRLQVPLNQLNDEGFVKATAMLNDEDFIREVYGAYLKREPEPSATTSFCEILRNGGSTRLTLLSSFRDSAEFKLLSIRYKGREAEIFGHWRTIEISYENLAEEMACYRQAIELCPNFYECYYNLGEALATQGEATEAIASYKKAVQIGMQLARENKLEEAFSCYQTALEVIPEQVAIHSDLGMMLVRLGWFEKLLTCYRQTFTKTSKSSGVYQSFGLLLAQEGLIDEAVACFQQASQIHRPSEGDIYENIWNRLNQLNLRDEENRDCEVEIQQEKAEDYFRLASRYKVITLQSLTEDDKKYLENVGLYLPNLELIAQNNFALEKIYIKSFSDSPKHLHEPLRLTLPYQQVLVETGYVYAVCPFSDKIVRSNQSFVINHYEVGHHDLQGFIYRFASSEIFYLMTGCPLGEKMLVYVPRLELIINLNPALVGLARPVESINKFKSYMVSCWQQVLKYISTDAKQVIDVIGLGFNIGHYLWQDLVGLHLLIKPEIQHKIDKILIGPGDYFSCREVFPEIAAEKFIEVEDVWDVFKTVLDNNYVAFRANGLLIEEELANKVCEVAVKKCSRDFLAQVEQAKKHFPLLSFQIRLNSRIWRGQVEGIANIIESLYSDFPNLGVLFDGWSVTGTEDSHSSSWSIIQKEKEMMAEIIAQIPSAINTYTAIGSTTYETVVWNQAIDLSIITMGAGIMYTSWIANKPSVVHGHTVVLDRHGYQVTTSQVRENIVPQVLIPKEFIVDYPNFDYDCDWKGIYTEVIKIIENLKRDR
ncbi:tetratricopeptide repeat protein [Microcoleus sp. S13C4]|uniref:tetratricopeptide repeat protein n=1 Tax=Microcoleus sp. S13C4 TaxID=3055410 RepID=UPI002FD33B18